MSNVTEGNGNAVSYEVTDDGVINRVTRQKSTRVATIIDEVLEFESTYFMQRYREEIIGFLAGDAEGNGQFAVKEFAIKGEKRDEVKTSIPPCPAQRMTMGDITPEVVDWYFKYKPQEFNVRYGVELLENGERRVEHVVRFSPIIDPSSGMPEIKPDKMGNAVTSLKRVEKEEGIIAKRPTHRTFTRDEMVNPEVEAL
jgi:hypothetical protein